MKTLKVSQNVLRALCEVKENSLRSDHSILTNECTFWFHAHLLASFLTYMENSIVQILLFHALLICIKL